MLKSEFYIYNSNIQTAADDILDKWKKTLGTETLWNITMSERVLPTERSQFEISSIKFLRGGD